MRLFKSLQLLIVLQLLSFAIMGIQGILATALYGFNLSREGQQDLFQVQK
jgi:hypothetical protein